MVNWIGECISTTRFSVSINGDLQGFFDGSRGLRQGGLSPYLFVLVMEVLLGFLGQMARHFDFRFHLHCEREEIAHLCFIDDLMIFCKAEVASVFLVRNCLDQFRVASDLSPNPDRSNIFLCGVAPNTKMQLLGVLGYREGKLPIRYLGVPLITSKLSTYDCSIPVD
jgi:hypothetical protein